MSDHFLSEFVVEDETTTPPEGPRDRRSLREAERAQREEDRRRKRRRTTTVGLASALVVIAIAVLVFVVPRVFGSGGEAKAVSDYTGTGIEETVDVTIPSGSGGADMAKILHQADVVASESAFIRAFNSNPNSSKIQANTYTLHKQQSGSNAVAALLDPANASKYRVTVTEGMRASTVFDKLAQVLDVPVDTVTQAAADPAALGVPADAVAASAGCQPTGCQLEGWLFPRTYPVPPGSDPKAILTQMVTETKNVLTKRGVPENEWTSTLTKASIVEKEVTRDEDRPKVARVIENRLAQSMPLGMDSTVAYGLGTSALDATSAQLADGSNPYNTRVHTGLPPTPIANPGEDSIDAVLNPDDGDWLYFTTVNLDTGETLFTADPTQNAANVQQWKQWECDNWSEYHKDAKPDPCPAG